MHSWINRRNLYKLLQFQLEDCSFEPGRRELSARMGLRNLLVSGRIKLTRGGTPTGLGILASPGFTYGRINRGSIPDATCSMTLRLRRAELGLHASEAGLALPSLLPAPTLGPSPMIPSPMVRTDAHFVEPELASMSVHAYGCSAPALDDPSEPVAQEVEDVFMRGMQTVVARAVQRRLQPALRDALLLHLGYSPSYGKR